LAVIDTSILMDFAVDLPSLSRFGFWSSMQSGGIKLPLDSHPNLHNSNIKGTKRKWNDNNGVEGPENPLLALGLGQSPSSSVVTKMSSAGLSTTYNKSSVGTLKAPHTVDMLNLQLSLSTGSSESALIDVNTIADQHLYSLESSVIASPVQISEEEGSASSCWIFGKCLVQPCVPNPETDFPSTMIQMLKNPVACSSGVSDSHKHNNRTKYCQFHGCTKGARGASSLCIAHGGGRRCQRPGCQKGAEGRTIYCKAHGGGRRCQHLGCTKSAEGRTDYCIAHGGGRRCSHLSCTRAARGKSGLCIRHGGGKRCQIENCMKSAEGSSGLCISHGVVISMDVQRVLKVAHCSVRRMVEGRGVQLRGAQRGLREALPSARDMVGESGARFRVEVCAQRVFMGEPRSVAHGGGKRCAVVGCPKSARGRTSFCVRHGGGKRCKFEGCGKSAQGSTNFCKAHGGGKRCSWSQLGSKFDVGEPLCDKYARGKTGLCAAHSALLQDHRVHGGGMLGPPNPVPVKLEKINEVAAEETFTKLELKKVGHSVLPQSGSSVPEGRVRGGGLIAMIASSSGFGINTGDQGTAVASDSGTHALQPTCGCNGKGAVPHGWT
ncbi:hypothetical protein MUK42_22465, partial [Musa troglodytarum]